MKATPLPLETIAASGFTHKVTVDWEDLVALGASASAALRLLPEDSGTLAAGHVVTKTGYRLVTAFDSSDAGTNSLVMDLGIGGGDVDAFMDSTETQLHVDGTEVFYVEANNATAGVTLPQPLLAAAYIAATFTAAGGTPLLSELTSGEVEIYLGIYNMAELAND